MSLPGRIATLAQRDAMTTLGLALSAVWLILVLLFWLLAPETQGGEGGVMRLAVAAGVVLPLVLIWLAVGLARSLAVLRAEADDLRRHLTQLREYAATRGAPPPVTNGPRPRPAESQPTQAAPSPPPPPSPPMRARHCRSPPRPSCRAHGPPICVRRRCGSTRPNPCTCHPKR
ncbi:hypothetical protein JHW45_03105 [Paracoccus stylophorae]|uniref:DUF4282 domain-containing protein n=1 Tax=Paracoccus stylophorae TaxID=659350 RepID=A0ABY7SYT5_9RHOB|nr:hypothetical protein [Paracoccus stylophorae]WCR11406.1 hypothetical protein JHW45_03105 [Paracoccus stylophorae]